MNVSLTPQLEALVDEKVRSGRYVSASEVVREALRLLDQRDRLDAEQMRQLRDDVRRGLDQIDAGKGTRVKAGDLPALADGIKASVRRRRASR